ncbi:MAG: hypothetical protein EA397_15590 [Deltaproteobacteria bacterium]|nr:MAG: hypothetical protein EA397_15590 [Deltaproteobacteria bacterium]
MKKLMLVSAVIFAAACGLSESKFNDEFGEKFCEMLEECSEGDMECEDGDADEGDVEDHGCDYNADAAKDCLDGEWGCSEATEFFPSFPEPPAACGRVLTNCPDASSDSHDSHDSDDSDDSEED